MTDADNVVHLFTPTCVFSKLNFHINNFTSKFTPFILAQGLQSCKENVI